MKSLILSLSFIFSLAVHASDECLPVSEKNVAIKIIDCKTPDSYALPKFNFHFMNSEATGYQKSLTVMGFLRGANGVEVKLNSPKSLDANLNLNVIYSPSNVTNVSEMDYANLPLKNAKVRNEWIQNAVVTPSNYVPYLLPEQKIAYLVTDAIQCKFIEAELKTIATCEEVRIDQGQYDCSCQYQILK